MTPVATRSAAGDPLAGRSLEIETPEHVALGYELAGPGSRFAAFLLDALLIVLILVALVGASGVTALVLLQVGWPASLTVLASIFLLATFGVSWGYFIWFEGRRDGRTPGKRALGLRVVQSGGFPITLGEAVIRNLVRVVDVQPGLSGILGGAMIILHPRAQRLGDLAAGTVVVRERAASPTPEEMDTEEGASEAGRRGGPPRLTEEEYGLLRSYVLRRDGLERTTRTRIAARLAAHFARRLENGGGVAGEAAPPPTRSRSDALLRRLYAEESGRRSAAGSSTGSGSPQAAALVRSQRDRWTRYDRLLTRSRGSGLGSLPEEEVAEFAALYREVAADLARARTYSASPELLHRLERSVGTGHNLLYSAPRRSLWAAWGWLASGFPALVRRRHRPILAAAFLFFGPALVTFGAVVADPGVARTIAPAELIARAEEAPERAAAGRGYAEVPEVLMPVFSSQIITNNVQVSFLAFAGGILAGLGTLYILLLNGVLLGGVAGLFRAEGADLYLWSFVLPHGVIELTAICIAGGAGLWMGSALVLPGRRSRGRALVERSKDAVSLLGGTVVLLLVAGLIEGFVSPSPLPDGTKLAFGALTALALYPYLLLAGGSGGEDVTPEGEDGVGVRAFRAASHPGSAPLRR